MTEQLTEERIDLETRPVVEVPIRVSWAPVPKVNLLPIEIVEGRRFRRTQFLLGAAVLGAVLVAGGGTFLAQREIGKANDELLASQAHVTTLQAEQARYAAVPKVIAQVEAAKAARTLAMGTDVLWSRYLNDIDAARPAGVYLNSITMSVNASASGGTASTNALSSAGIGALIVSGTGQRYTQVSSWLEGENKITGVSSSTLVSATLSDGKITFSANAIVDSDALSGRYAKESG